MGVYVVVAYPTHRDILQVVLAKEVESVPLQFHVGGTESGAESRARTLLMLRDDAVALAVDTRATDESRIRESRELFELALKDISPRSSRWTVCLFIPEIERLFFLDPALEGDLFHEPLSERDRIEAEFRPKVVLQRLLQARKLSFEDLLERLRNADLTTLRDMPPLIGLREFIDRQAARAR
jgi:hypothetical protein